MAKLRQATIQDHFQFGQLVSPFMSSPQDDDDTRAVYVTDSSGKTSKASSNEYNVAAALQELGFRFQFQLSLAGGRGRAFGVVLDFLVDTVPMPTPLWVHGEHWHTGADRAKDIRQQDAVRTALQGQINIPVEIWGSESNTPEMALVYTRKAFR